MRSGDKRVIREWELLCQRERLGVALGAERLSEAWQPQNARLASRPQPGRGLDSTTSGPLRSPVRVGLNPPVFVSGIAVEGLDELLALAEARARGHRERCHGWSASTRHPPT